MLVQPKLERAKKRKKEGKKGRKYGRTHRNGKPHGMRGGCGCEFCRKEGRQLAAL